MNPNKTLFNLRINGELLSMEITPAISMEQMQSLRHIVKSATSAPMLAFNLGNFLDAEGLTAVRKLPPSHYKRKCTPRARR